MNEKYLSEPNLPESDIEKEGSLNSTDSEISNESTEKLIENTNQDSTKYESISIEKIINAVNQESPIKCIRECLEICFDNESIRIFCQDYFPYVFKRLNPLDRLDHVISQIIRYCDQRGNVEIEYLWQKVKLERKDNYYKYYLRWQKAVKDNPEINRLNIDEYAFKASEKKDEMQSNQNNPLAKSSDELTSWFFNELQSEEQSLILTAALFEGMSRQKLVQAVTSIEKFLQ